MGRTLDSGEVLHQSRIRLPGRPDHPVAPRQRGGPFDRVTTVARFIHERIELALRAETAACVLKDHDIAAWNEVRWLVWRRLAALIVRRANHQRRKLPRGVGPVDIGIERHAIARPHRQMLFFDDLVNRFARFRRHVIFSPLSSYYGYRILSEDPSRCHRHQGGSTLTRASRRLQKTRQPRAACPLPQLSGRGIRKRRFAYRATERARDLQKEPLALSMQVRTALPLSRLDATRATSRRRRESRARLRR